MKEKIIAFLVNREWEVLNETQYFYELKPPATFNLAEDFRLHIPKNIDKIDSIRFLDNILEIIADLYGLTIDDLNVVLKKENTVLKVRIYDKQTEDGRIPLTKFEDIIERIRFILSDTASFVIDRSVTSTRVPDEVSKYLRLCNFMQTEKGSFVAKIQLPSKELIKDKELFDRKEIYSEEINKKLSEVLDFVNQNIFEGDAKASEEYLLENESKINIKLFKNIETLFEKADVKNIDFSFHNIESSTAINNENITKEKIYKLNQFVEEIELHTYEVGDFTFRGKIITLKSKNPDGLKNSVIFTGLNENMMMIATANLDSQHYKDAIEAHKIKKDIIVTGLAKRTKSRARFIEITGFEIGE